MQAYPKSKSSLIRSAAHTLLSARVHAPVWPNHAAPRGIGWQVSILLNGFNISLLQHNLQQPSTNHCTCFTCWMSDSTNHCT